MLREESLPGVGIWMTMDDFQINGIRQDVRMRESMKSALRCSIALGPGCLRCKMLSSGVAAATYTFSTCCKCHC